MKILKKILKVSFIVISILLIGVYIAFAFFTSPKSDKKVLEPYKTSVITPVISKETFKGFDYRKIEIRKDTALPTIVFVHGTIGSLNDFSKYMSDSLLQTKANMISYDRVGYNYKDKNPVQESIAFEKNMLVDIIKEIPNNKVVLVGYSYGGPIALAVKKKVKKIILLAPAVHAKVEPMPWMLKFYKWKLTRWLVPKIWKQASKEKLSHKKDLNNFENSWKETPNKVVSIHGNGDWIVPYENSLFLSEQFSKDQFTLVTIPDVNHGLVWSKFKLIKQQILKHLD